MQQFFDRTLLTLICCTVTLLLASAQTCPESSLINRQVRASETDAEIPFELARHQVWINTDCDAKGLLLIHLPGTFDNPSRTTLFPALAANSGYHVIGLKYPNDLSAQTACRESSDADCYEDFRREIVEGMDLHLDIEVDRANSIENRIQQLLQYLAAAFPAEGWGQFLENENILWDKLLISGHSQGGGHAAFMAKDRVLQRVIMFASPNDYDAVNEAAAAWTSAPHLTPDSCYYAFGNLFDDIVDFREEYLQWNALGMGTFGDTVNVQEVPSPYLYSRMLYTHEQKSGLAVNHSLMITDEQVTLDEDGVPIYKAVWEYLLGLNSVVNGIAEVASGSKFRVYPNPCSDFTLVEFDSPDVHPNDIRIVNLNGHVFKVTVEKIGSSLTIDCSQLTPGVYYLQTRQNGHYQSVQRLVVVR